MAIDYPNVENQYAAGAHSVLVGGSQAGTPPPIMLPMGSEFVSEAFRPAADTGCVSRGIFSEQKLKSVS